MKFKWLYFLVLILIIFFSLIGGYIYIDQKFKNSNIRTYEMKKKEFISESYEGYIFEITKGVEGNQRVLTITLNDGSNRVYDICSKDIIIKERDVVKKKKDDKFLYINSQPIELYKFICNPN